MFKIILWTVLAKTDERLQLLKKALNSVAEMVFVDCDQQRRGLSRCRSKDALSDIRAPDGNARCTRTQIALVPALSSHHGGLLGELLLRQFGHGDIVDLAGAEHRDFLKHQDIARDHQVGGAL